MVARFRAFVPLGVVLAAALALRLIFFVGPVHIDGQAYQRLAYEFARGGLHSGWSGDSTQRRITTYVPVGVAYRLFDVSDLSTAAWPLFCSLATVVLVFLIARRLCGPTAAVLAALLWALLPLDISLATTVLPDGPLTLFSTAAVWCFLRGDASSGRGTLAWYAASALCLIGAVFAKQAALITAGYLLMFGAVRWRHAAPRARLGLVLALLAAGFMVYSASVSFMTAMHFGKLQIFRTPWFEMKDLIGSMTDWSAALIAAPELWFLIPLGIVSIGSRLAARQRGDLIAASWLAATFLYLEWGSQSPYYYFPASGEGLLVRYNLFVLVPLVILIGSYVASAMEHGQACWTAAGIAVGTVLIAWFGSREAPTLPAWVLNQPPWSRPFATMSALAGGIAAFGGIASPLWLTAERRFVRSFSAVALLTLVAVASLHPSFEASVKYRMPTSENARIAVEYLKQWPELPWLAQNDTLARFLDYESRYVRGYETARTRDWQLRLAPDTPAEIGVNYSAYVLVDETGLTLPSRIASPGPTYLATPPPNWWQMATFGSTPGFRLRLYRVLTPDDAGRELREARARQAEHPDAVRSHRLAGARANAGDFCEAAKAAWASPGARGPARSSELAPRLAACYALDPSVAGANLLANADFKKGFEGWSRPTAPGVQAELVADGVEAGVLLVKAPSAEHRGIVLQGAMLKPSTPYVFEATFKTTAPVVALYWESDIGRFDSEAAFPEWTTRRYVFITPPWDGKPHHADIHPFLLSAPGQVYVKRIKLAELRFD